MCEFFRRGSELYANALWVGVPSCLIARVLVCSVFQCRNDPVGSAPLARVPPHRTGSAAPEASRYTPAQDQTRAAGASQPGAGVRVRPEPGEPELLTEGAAGLPVPDPR